MLMYNINGNVVEIIMKKFDELTIDLEDKIIKYCNEKGYTTSKGIYTYRASKTFQDIHYFGGLYKKYIIQFFDLWRLEDSEEQYNVGVSIRSLKGTAKHHQKEAIK